MSKQTEPRKKKQDWLSVIWLTLVDEMYKYTRKDILAFNYDPFWLEKRLTYIGLERSRKFLRIWNTAIFVIFGLVVASIVLSRDISATNALLFVIADVSVVAFLVYCTWK